MIRARQILLPAVLGAAVLALGACSQEKAADPAATQAAPDAKPGISVSDATIVMPAVAGNPAAAYFTLANTATKAVTLAAVAIDGAGKTEMHQTTGGSMSPVDTVDVANGASVAFAPGGLHVMAFDLDPKLAPGGTAEVTLIFADGDKISTQAKVVARADAPAMGGMDHGETH